MNQPSTLLLYGFSDGSRGLLSIVRCAQIEGKLAKCITNYMIGGL